jgi:hypothetical protein
MYKEQIAIPLNAMIKDLTAIEHQLEEMYRRLLPGIEGVYQQEKKLLGSAESLTDTLLAVKSELLTSASAIKKAKRFVLQYLKGT